MNPRNAAINQEYLIEESKILPSGTCLLSLICQLINSTNIDCDMKHGDSISKYKRYAPCCPVSEGDR